MSDLTRIRAGHTEVADGQCGLCDVPWPCDTGVVLAALAKVEAIRLTPERIANLRGWHVPMGRVTQSGTAANYDICKYDGDVMPCAVTETLDALAAAEARAEQAERERDDWKDAYERLSARKNQQSDEALALMQLFGEQRQVAEQHNAALRERLATVEAAGGALIEAWDNEAAAYDSEDDVDWGTRMGAAHLRRQQAGEAFRAALAATPAADEPAELSMIRAGDELVLEIDAALDDAATPAAGEVADSYQPVPPKSEFPMTVRLDVQDRREQQRQHGGEG